MQAYAANSKARIGINGLPGQYGCSNMGGDTATYVFVPTVSQNTTQQIVGLIEGADTIIYYQVYVINLSSPTAYLE